MRESDVSVVLVVPPVISPVIPTLGAAVLRASCARAGIPARLHYANISFAARVGFMLAQRLASAPPQTMLGEAIFWGAAFPERAAEHGRVLEALLRVEDPTAQIARLAVPTRDEVLDCVGHVPAFVEKTVERVLACRPRIVGVSSMCQQTLASIAIARAVKARAPDVVTVLGGANAAEPMGRALLDVTDAFDFVFSGEADEAFPAFCRAIACGERPADRVIECEPARDLDAVATPDYDDYYEELEALRRADRHAAEAPVWLVFESSRGCWWADAHNCSFCGFNAPGARFRARSPDRIIAEIDALTARYSPEHMFAADTIMARDLPSSVLARLAERPVRVSLSYEVKSNLREADLDACARAGVVEIQPGIESLSTHVLTLMSKGVTALENVRLLRDARAFGIDVVWNFLTAIPGETRDDYERMLAIVPLLEHLRPPTRWGPIRISRYSPYFRTPGRYGIDALRPWTAYCEFYGEHADRLAHHFFGAYETEYTRSPDLQGRLAAIVRHWADAWMQPAGPPALTIRRFPDGRSRVEDTRTVGPARSYVIDEETAVALERVCRPIAIEAVTEAERAVLQRLAAVGLVVCYEGQFLALPVTCRPIERLSEGRAAADASRLSAP